MLFNGMTKLKRKFFKSMYNKITKKYPFYFSFILELKIKKIKKITRHKNISTVRRRKKKKKEGRKKRKR